MAKKDKLEKELETYKAKSRTMREKLAEGAASGIDVALTIAGAFGGGAAMEKYAKDGKEPVIMGIPADGLIGAGLLAAEVFDVAGSSSRHVGAVGLGLVACFSARAGKAMVQKSSQPKASGIGALPQGTGGPALPQGDEKYSAETWQKMMAAAVR